MTEPLLDTILLVDDDKVTNLMHERLIRKAGLARHVAVATDGEAALSYISDVIDGAAPSPQIILLDLNMPRMNGFEFLEAYQGLPAQIKQRQDIVMLSTSVLHEDHKRAVANPDVVEFVVKPIRTEKFEAICLAYKARRAS